MARGELVPDDLMYDRWASACVKQDCERGFILYGFPRNPAQAGWPDAFLEHEFFDKSRGNGLPIVIRIDVDYNQLLRRITGRRSCPVCGRIYNVYSQPPRVAERCDVDGSTLVTREDDREGSHRRPTDGIRTQTKPVAEYYARKGGWFGRMAICRSMRLQSRFCRHH